MDKVVVVVKVAGQERIGLMWGTDEMWDGDRFYQMFRDYSDGSLWKLYYSTEGVEDDYGNIDYSDSLDAERVEEG